MKLESRILTVVAATLIAWAVATAPVRPVAIAQPPVPTDDSQYFSETGHGVEWPFYAFFVAQGGIARFGYPITDQYVDPISGLTVQYFQKARLEYHAANPEPYTVQLGLLGEELGRRQPPLPVREIPTASDPNCRYFVETGQAVCYGFLRFFNDTGGIDLYGYPIGRPVIEGNRIVQYFQRTRFEWYPERAEGQRVQTGPLGTIYYDSAQLDPALRRPTLVNASNRSITALRTTASLAQPFIAADRDQTLYVTVVDQLGQPASGASVQIRVAYPSGAQSFSLPPTDAQGATRLTFPAGSLKPNTTVTIDVVVTAAGLTSTTRTSYLIWFY